MSNNKVNEILNHMEQIVVGKRKILKQLYVAVLTNGHILLEDVPGVGKTLMVSTLAKVVSGKFNRIQFTPDVMPSDITGFSMFNPASQKFEYRPGVAMCNFLLGDEINRASPKTQSSLLEAMEEYQITIDGKTIPLQKPFIVLATQNPIESYGTYPLPEAQMDRFFIKLSMGYPKKSEERDIINRFGAKNPMENVKSVASLEDLIHLQGQVMNVKMTNDLKDYIIDIVSETRRSRYVKLGVSPRGTLHLFKAAKAWAFLQQRNYVIPDDIQEMCVPVLAHRIALNTSAKQNHFTPEKLVEEILHQVRVIPNGA
jgi:MoxR-like ATPase